MLPLPASNLPFFTDEETETGARNWGERDKDKGTDTKGFRARLQERACGHRLEGRSEEGKESTAEAAWRNGALSKEGRGK